MPGQIRRARPVLGPRPSPWPPPPAASAPAAGRTAPATGQSRPRPGPARPHPAVGEPRPGLSWSALAAARPRSRPKCRVARRAPGHATLLSLLHAGDGAGRARRTRAPVALATPTIACGPGRPTGRANDARLRGGRSSAPLEPVAPSASRVQAWLQTQNDERGMMN